MIGLQSALALAGWLVASASASGETAAPASRAHTTVQARLLDAGTPTSHCGIMRFDVVMKFRVTGSAAPLYAVVTCPELHRAPPRPFWKVGDAYEVELGGVAPRGQGAFVDAFDAEAGERLSVRTIGRVP